MVTVNFTVRHRPARIGFLVHPGDFADLQSAAALCCVLWGGVYNPVIPVAAATDATADDLLRQFQVDVLVPVGQSSEIDKFVARYPWLRSPRMSGNRRRLALKEEDGRLSRRAEYYRQILGTRVQARRRR